MIFKEAILFEQLQIQTQITKFKDKYVERMAELEIFFVNKNIANKAGFVKFDITEYINC